MDEQDRLREKALFAQASDLPIEERKAFLDAACRGETVIRARVERLLAFDARFDSDLDQETFLKSPLVRDPEPAPSRSASSRSQESGLPSHIGRYRIVCRHGEGGMGVVYEAEQENPRRTVALKVLRPGLLLPELVSRFSHEAQILGRLQHPGIAQVYEAGMDADGQPFFAMEFIRGMPLDEYARRNGLNTAARLELIARVCDAVQHAHDNGVIHRDLKPGNILVDETGQPKVLDFGVAHVSAANLLMTSSRTQTGQLLGTLSYMSPEQIAATPGGIDGRSDVYTLGVILFELLAHRLPYLLEQLPPHEVARVIQQEEPSRLGSVNADYRGDVEIVVAKALEKDRARRYALAGDLASDIRRHLRGEVILARPASVLYQLHKFARRHKALVAATSGIIVALLVGTIVSILFALRAAENARLADENARVAERNARAASERERAATIQSYRARIAAAVAALSNHDVVDAARHVDAAPLELRAWEWRHLRNRLDDSTSVRPAAAGEIQYLVPDANGIRIAAFKPSQLRLIDPQGQELWAHALPSEITLVNLLSTRNGLFLVAKDSERGASASNSPGQGKETNGTIKLLDELGRIRIEIKGPPGWNSHIAALTSDGQRLAVVWTAHEEWLFKVYDVDSGDVAMTSSQEMGFTWALAFSPDGKRIATGGEDGLTRLWDATNGAMTGQCRGHTRKVLSVAFGPDSRRLLTASADGTVRQWDSMTGREVETPYNHHTGEVVTATYSPDGLSVASGGTDRTVRVWGAANGQDVAVLHGHTGVVSQLAFTDGSHRLASASNWEHLGSTVDGTVRTWDVGLQAGTSVLRGHTSYIYPVAYSPDGQWIASGGWDKQLRLWDAVSGEICATLPHPGYVLALAFSLDSSLLISGCYSDEWLRVWNVATAKLQKRIKGPGSGIRAIAVSPDRSRIAASDWSGKAAILQFATGAEVYSFGKARPGDEGVALAYSPDGRWLAITGEDRTQIDICETQTFHRSASLTGHTSGIHSVAFSADGQLLASASTDRTIRVWDVSVAKCIAVLPGHTDAVYTAVFHPDGKRVASAGSDRAIWMWDLATGQDVARLDGHTNYVYSLAFSPDGRSLVSGSGDGTVRIWGTEPLLSLQMARREAGARRLEADRVVARLVAKSRELDQVVARLRADQSLSDAMRHAAVREVMRRSQQFIP